MRNAEPIRCLLGMLGTDVHNKGIRTLAQMLRDAGIDVIYVGEHNTVPGMVRGVVADNPDIVGLSFSSSTYLDYTRQFIDEMQQQGVGDIPLMLGGIIHQEDYDALKTMGVSAVFGPGSRPDEILSFIMSHGK